MSSGSNLISGQQGVNSGAVQSCRSRCMHQRIQTSACIIFCILTHNMILSNVLTCMSTCHPFRNLRKTVHAKLLINLCFALVGLYVTFIISTVSTGVPVLCGVVSALMHYFFLAVFFWMAAEAFHLHRKLVSVFKPDIEHYVFIVMAICWGRLV